MQRDDVAIPLVNAEVHDTILQRHLYGDNDFSGVRTMRVTG